MSDEDQLEFLKEILKDLCKNSDINYDNIGETKKHVISTMEMVFDDVNLELIDYNFFKLLKVNFEYDYNNGGVVIYNKEDLDVPDEYKSLVEHVDFLANLPQPEQRTEEWFDMRRNMITASCAAQAIGENPYPNQTPDDLILDKLNLGAPYQDNKFVHHGKKYEEIATKIYENIYDIKVEEYGLIPHVSKPPVPFIGASPDGIGSRFTLNNDFSEMVGRMLEIKCPFSRKIKFKGEIDGEICPHYYHCQVQQQLECCDLEYCDFWQCTIKEFYTKEDLLNDNTPLNYYEEQEKELNVPINCRQGCIIQLLPKNKIKEFCLFDAKYIYPKDVDITTFEYDQWILSTIDSLYRDYKSLMKDYVFDRVLYWKLTDCHNVKIKRDKEWFKSKYILFKNLWDRIVLYRNDKKALKHFLDEKNKGKKPRVKKEAKIKPEDLFVDSENSEDLQANL